MDTEADNKQDSSAPAKKGSKLWMLIVALVVWAAAAIWLVPILKQFNENPIVKDVMAMKDQVMAMNHLTQTQISDQAEHTTAKELLKDPDPLKGRYVVITGNVNKEESMNVDANVARNIFSDSEWKAYILDDGVVLLDITGEAENYPEGATIKGFGKVFVLRLEDIWDLPYVGPDLEREFANIKGMEEKVVFFISKGVKLIDLNISEDENPCGEGENPCGEGENPCGEGENPCGEGENPCGEGENPCGEGENPCGEGENPCGEGENPCGEGENPCGENPCG